MRPLDCRSIVGGIKGAVTRMSMRPMEKSVMWLHTHTSCSGVVASDLTQPSPLQSAMVSSQKTQVMLLEVASSPSPVARYCSTTVTASLASRPVMTSGSELLLDGS